MTVSNTVSYLDRRGSADNVCTSFPSRHPADPLTRSAVLHLTTRTANFGKKPYRYDIWWFLDDRCETEKKYIYMYMCVIFFNFSFILYVSRFSIIYRYLELHYSIFPIPFIFLELITSYKNIIDVATVPKCLLFFFVYCFTVPITNKVFWYLHLHSYKLRQPLSFQFFPFYLPLLRIWLSSVCRETLSYP